MNPNLAMFFNGFTYTRDFDKTEKTFMGELKFDSYTFEEKLNIIRKADIFLSGFGITYKDIKNTLIPNIHLELGSEDTTPLKLFNIKGIFEDEYIPNTAFNSSIGSVLSAKIAELQQKETRGMLHSGTVHRVKTMFLLYKILLNRGEDISKEFIAQYNEKFYKIPYNLETTANYGKMTNEDYHNEFVKFLLKAWTGTPSLVSNKIYKINYYSDVDYRNNSFPASHTCFSTLDIYKNYTTAKDLYNDLVVFVTSGTNFGEALTGGKKKKSKSK
jgi:hypothetical protein